MINGYLEGLKVSLNDENIVEDLEFSGDKVIATLGTKDVAICATIFNLQIVNPSALTVEGQGFEIRWENIEIGNSEITTIRNGTPAIYAIISRS